MQPILIAFLVIASLVAVGALVVLVRRRRRPRGGSVGYGLPRLSREQVAYRLGMVDRPEVGDLSEASARSASPGPPGTTTSDPGASPRHQLWRDSAAVLLVGSLVLLALVTRAPGIIGGTPTPPDPATISADPPVLDDTPAPSPSPTASPSPPPAASPITEPTISPSAQALRTPPVTLNRTPAPTPSPPSPAPASTSISTTLATTSTTIDWRTATSASAGPWRITGVGRGSKGRLATDGSILTYDPDGCATGLDSPAYTISDGVTSRKATAVVDILRPGLDGLSSVPVTDTPSIRLEAGGTLERTVPVRVRWCGVAERGSQVEAYRVQESADGGSTWPTVVSRATTARSTLRSIAPSTRYAWRVRTTDSAARTGTYRQSATARVSIRQDTPSATVAYSGAWLTTTSSRASGGTLRSASSASAAVTIAVPAGTRQVGLVGPTGSGGGSFNVWVDGKYAGSYSERSSTASFRRILFVRSLDAGARHKIVLRPVGNGRVYLDAIVSLR